MMGNYMNAGSRNQQSFGFDLNYLTKLSSTKSADQKTTLLHFLANTCDLRFPDIKDFAVELRNVEEASKGTCTEVCDEAVCRRILILMIPCCHIILLVKVIKFTCVPQLCPNCPCSPMAAVL